MVFQEYVLLCKIGIAAFRKFWMLFLSRFKKIAIYQNYIHQMDTAGKKKVLVFDVLIL